MTVKELKKILELASDDAEIVIADSEGVKEQVVDLAWHLRKDRNAEAVIFSGVRRWAPIGGID